MAGNARYWVGVCYPENMVSDWENQIGDLVQVPFAYCIHNIDHDSKSEHRKDHVHIMLAFSNTTTYNNALNTFKRLSADGRSCINKCLSVVSVRNQYDYLIHDTDACRKQGKELYPSECRITGNNFDIGAYEQISLEDKREKVQELKSICRCEGFTNFADLDDYIDDHMPDDSLAREVKISYHCYLEAYIRGVYLRKQAERADREQTKLENAMDKHFEDIKEAQRSDLNQFFRDKWEFEE